MRVSKILVHLGLKGGEGKSGTEEPITFDEFSEFFREHETWRQEWVTHVWQILINRADQFGLELVDDPDADPRSEGKAIVRQSFRQADVPSWMSHPSNVYQKTGLGPVCERRLLEFQRGLGE
ncbi:hypothetical protein KY386_00460 [Candidatus Parcubacteria bacterium]|nr:hypothetical protein [Candidatus Parcubacteria bacterium]